MRCSLRLLFSLALIFASLTLVIGFTDAAIYDNGDPDLQAGIQSDFGGGIVITQEAGDDFVLSAGGDVITDIHWWGIYLPANPLSPPSVPSSDDFSIRIFNITSGVPDTSPFYSNDTAAVTRIDANLNFDSIDVFEYSVDVSPISLSPGTPYLLSIVNNTAPDIWYWLTSQQSGDAVVRLNDTGPWSPLSSVDPGTFPIGAELAFTLPGPSSVPEPSTFLLFGAGLAGVGIMRRKLRK